jgi:hypothetical protein
MNLIFHDLLGVILEVYINDMVVKSARLKQHLADLRIAFARMEKYGLKMNPLKCVFGVSAERFLGFIVHEKGIHVDPKKVESISNLAESTYKKDVQKLLGKLNYLRCFISNLAGKVKSFLPLVCMKHEDEFAWGEEQKKAFEKIKECLSKAPVLREPKVGEAFKLYVAAQDNVTGAVLTQEDKGKKFMVAYISRRLQDAETRYAYIEKLCLPMYYVCAKFLHYILSSECTVICHHDIVKYMLHRPILGRRVRKWAYSLIE